MSATLALASPPDVPAAVLTTTVMAAPADVLASAHRVVSALPVRPLYARIDGVQARDGFAVMEVEVHEPGLAFTLAPAAAERFADAIIRRSAARS